MQQAELVHKYTLRETPRLDNGTFGTFMVLDIYAGWLASGEYTPQEIISRATGFFTHNPQMSPVARRMLEQFIEDVKSSLVQEI